MRVSVFIVDWDEVVRRFKSDDSGDLLENIHDAVDNGGPWAEEAELFSDTHSIYCMCAEAYEEFRDALPSAVRKQANQFMNRLITYDGYCQDLVKDNEDFALSISPKSVAKFVALSEQIDFKSFKKAFDAECSEDTKNHLDEDDPADAFAGVFLPYVESWISALRQAAGKKRGILVQMG